MPKAIGMLVGMWVGSLANECDCVSLVGVVGA